MLKIYSEKHISKLISVRNGETKLGENLRFISGLEELQKTPAKFVIFGIPEDIGVRANSGKAGTSTAWKSFLKTFVNVQENTYNSGRDIIMLGEVNTSEYMRKAENITPEDPNYFQKLGDLVSQLDLVVSDLVKKIITSGKIPVIVGGGHNNAYGNIKGAAEAYQIPINVLNIDAHTDLRLTDHRHSGNGFSYAFKNGFLKRYSVFGLQKNYTPQYIFDSMNASKNIQYSLFEDFNIKDKLKDFKEDLNFVNKNKFGLEVDCDAIMNFPSSAISPSGFTLDEVRHFINIAAKEKNCCYLHICEAIALENFPTGKAISFMVTDFLREKNYA